MKKYLLLPIGPSGVGKSTLYKQLQVDYAELVSYSWDSLRLEWYCPEDYSKAWTLACKDKKFQAKAMRVFEDLVQDGKDIYVDNLNLTPKSRRPFIEHAERYGYITIAYVIKYDIPTLLTRRTLRPDKTLPEAAIHDQVKRIELPTDHEVDEVRYV